MEREVDQINVIPLVDIMLVLLVIVDRVRWMGFPHVSLEVVRK